MKSFFILNDKRYVAKEINFNTVCDLDEMGISISDAKKKPMSMVRAYIALSMGVEKEEAGTEIEQHLINGGSFDDIIKVMLEKMENSDFFRNLNKTEEQETTESESKAKKTK